MKERFLIAFIIISIVFVVLNALGDPHSNNMKLWSAALIAAVVIEIIVKLTRQNK